MESLGSDFTTKGSVMSRSQLEEVRQKRGECITCGRKCFQRKLFKMIPLTEEGMVLEGRCLHCRPLDDNYREPSARGSSRDSSVDNTSNHSNRGSQTKPQDLERFIRSQSNLSSRTLLSPMVTGRKGVLRSSSVASRSESRSNCSMSRGETLRRAASLNPVMAGNRSSSILRGTAATSPPASSPRATSVPSPSSQGNFGSVKEVAIKSAPRRKDFRRHSSHSDINTPIEEVEGKEKKPIRATMSGNVPTREELERAHLTLLAARENGLVSSEIATIDGQLNRMGAADQDSSELDEASAISSQNFPSERYSYDYSNGGRQESQTSLYSRRSGGGRQESQNSLYGRYVGGRQESQNSLYGKYVGGRQESQNSLYGRSLGGRQESQASLYGKHIGGRQESQTSLYDDVSFSVSNSIHSHTGGEDEDISSQASERSSTARRSSDASEQKFVSRLRQVGKNYGEILVILREAVDIPQVLSRCLTQLARSSMSHDEQTSLGEMGAALVISDVMSAHPGSVAVQLSACDAVATLTEVCQNQVAMTDSGVLELMLAAMDRFPNQLDLQEKAVTAMSNLGKARENLAKFVQKSVIQQIGAAMNHNTGVASLQVKGCNAIANVASHDVVVRKRIMGDGAGGAVILSMVMHPDDPVVQESALIALGILCEKCDSNVSDICSLGGIDPVIGALQVHRDEVGVQTEGSKALYYLSSSADNKAQIGEGGGIDVLIRAMWVHAENVKLLEWCVRALFTLTDNPGNCDIVLEVGGITAIINCMQGQVESSTVQEMGCGILTNLAASAEEVQARIVDEGALDTIVLAMVLFADNRLVQEQGCKILTLLVMPSVIEAMRASNIPDLVQAAAVKFPETCSEPANQVLAAFDDTVYA